MRSEGRGSALATAGLALARSRARPAPSASRAVEWRSTAAEMSVGKNASAWCRALGTGRARGALRGERPAAARGLRSLGGLEWMSCHAVRFVQHASVAGHAGWPA